MERWQVSIDLIGIELEAGGASACGLRRIPVDARLEVLKEEWGGMLRVRWSGKEFLVFDVDLRARSQAVRAG